MIYGVGIDLLDFAQVDLKNDKLIQKVLTAEEYNVFVAKATDVQRISFFAGRFAAKEAYVKALGTGFRDISFQNIEVLNNELGQPTITLINMKQPHIDHFMCHLSISHSASGATAIVVLEEEERG